MPLLLGANRVELRSGHCPECRLSSAEPRIEAHLEMAARVAERLGLGPPERRSAPRAGPHAKETDPVSDGGVSRRGLFLSAMRRGRSVATHLGAALVDRLDGAEQDDEQERDASPSTPWLRDLLASLMAHLDIDAARAVGSPFAMRPETVGDGCVPCPVCASACPAEALSHARQGDRAGLWMTPERCTACGVCVPACPEGALRLEPEVDFGAWGRGQVRLASPRHVACRSCDAEALTPALGLCARCYRMAGSGGP